MVSLLQRLRSCRHRFWFEVSQRTRLSRGIYHENPVGKLPAASQARERRITALRERYQVCFESQMTAATSVNNYEYLDILDSTWDVAPALVPSGGILCDVGCASFWYAQTLQAFFRPSQMIGVEIEAHRLFKDGHSRIDYAKGHLSTLPNARFVAADYIGFEHAANVITAWFPFVTPAALLAWRLPLNLLAPDKLFRQIFRNLTPGGVFVMVNHGFEEAGYASALCVAAGLRRIGAGAKPGILSTHRLHPPVASLWSD